LQAWQRYGCFSLKMRRMRSMIDRAREGYTRDEPQA